MRGIVSLERCSQPENQATIAPEWAMHEAGGPVRLVHTNNHGVELKRTVGEKGLETIYEAMEKSGAEVEFQSGPAMPKDLDGVIARAVSAGGTSVELWQDYQGFPEMADAELRRSAKRLEQNRN